MKNSGQLVHYNTSRNNTSDIITHSVYGRFFGTTTNEQYLNTKKKNKYRNDIPRYQNTWKILIFITHTLTTHKSTIGLSLVACKNLMSTALLCICKMYEHCLRYISPIRMLSYRPSWACMKACITFKALSIYTTCSLPLCIFYTLPPATYLSHNHYIVHHMNVKFQRHIANVFILRRI